MKFVLSLLIRNPFILRTPDQVDFNVMNVVIEATCFLLAVEIDDKCCKSWYAYNPCQLIRNEQPKVALQQSKNRLYSLPSCSRRRNFTVNIVQTWISPVSLSFYHSFQYRFYQTLKP